MVEHLNIDLEVVGSNLAVAWLHDIMEEKKRRFETEEIFFRKF